jgi:hypothetical protein
MLLAGKPVAEVENTNWHARWKRRKQRSARRKSITHAARTSATQAVTTRDLAGKHLAELRGQANKLPPHARTG